jgi:predicted transcriptional regulator
MAKVNVSIPDELLEEVDSLAAELHRSRSGFVQEATAHYVTRVRSERERAEREKAIHQATLGMRRLSGLLPPGEDGTLLIRRDRDSRDFQ